MANPKSLTDRLGLPHKTLDEIIAGENAEVGRVRVTTNPATDLCGCHFCLTIYQPGQARCDCPKCLNQGHIYRLHNADEAEWYADLYTIRGMRDLHTQRLRDLARKLRNFSMSVE